MGPNLLKAFKIIFIFSLLVLGLYSSVITGFSWDEYFHHINGNVRFQFYATLGAVDRLDFRNIEFYPGFYDTLSYSCLLYTSPSPRDKRQSRMPSSA